MQQPFFDKMYMFAFSLLNKQKNYKCYQTYPKHDATQLCFLFLLSWLMMLSSPIVAMWNRYLIDFSEWEVFVNDDGTRSFLSVEVRKKGLAEVCSKSSFSFCFTHFLLVFSSFWGSSIVCRIWSGKLMYKLYSKDKLVTFQIKMLKLSSVCSCRICILSVD